MRNRSRSATARRRLVLSGALAGLAVVLVATAFGFRLLHGSAAPLANLAWTDETPAWSPDGREIVFASNRAFPASSTDALYSMRAGGTNVRRLTLVGLDAREPSFSPDGRRIVFAGNEVDSSGTYTETGAIDTVSSRGTDLRVLSGALVGDADIPAWSPDGHRVAFLETDRPLADDARTDLYVVGADGRGLRRVAVNVDGWAFAWSPDGKKIVVGGADGRVYVIRVRARKPLRVTIAADMIPTSIVTDVAWSPDGAEIAFVRGEPTLDGTGDVAPRSLWVLSLGGRAHRLRGVLDSESVGGFGVTIDWLRRRPPLLAVFDGKDTQLVRGDGRVAGSVVSRNRGLLAAGSASPDGKQLLLVDGPDSGAASAIFRAGVSGAPLRQLTQLGSG